MGLITGLVLAATLHAAPPSLEEIVVVARGGAPGMALRLLDTYQAAPEVAVGDWVAAERERVHILAAASDWRALDERLAALPPTLPAPFLDWAAERRAEALLQLGDGVTARAVLQRLIWTTDADDDTLRAWRLLVVRSFLVEGDRDAALTGLRRYAQDYGPDDPVLRALHGEVLLAAGRADDAVHVLGDADDPLRWLAVLRADARDASTAFERSVRLGSARAASSATRRAAWTVAAEAARRMDNPGAEVAALERALRFDPGNETVPAVLDVEPAALWAAYRRWGRVLGNAAHLIVGIDDGWMDAADAVSATEPAQARALYATVARDTHDPAVAAAAHAGFSRLADAEPGSGLMLTALYLRGGVFGSPEEIPAAVRYLLVDEVLDTGDLALGARMLSDLADAPDGADPVTWQLRRARVLVLGGHRDAGRAALSALLDGSDDYDVDRFLQVLFDLQSAGAHEQALPLFARVYARGDLGIQTRREILYWMADSWRALDDHHEAARLYLRSALLADPYAMDQWAQTARYQAADALERASLPDDAASLLRSLMNASPDAARRALLQHRIDELGRHAPPDGG